MKTQFDYEKNGTTYSVVWADQPEHAKDYWAGYGVEQSLADSHASVITKVMSDLAKKAKDLGESFPAPKTKEYKVYAESQVVLDIAKPLIDEAIRKRLQRVFDGKMFTRETDPFKVECRKVAIATIERQSKEESIELPDRKSDDWQDLVTYVMGTDEVIAEAKERLARPGAKISLKEAMEAKKKAAAAPEAPPAPETPPVEEPKVEEPKKKKDKAA